MKAIVYARYGSPDVLQVKNVEQPTPGKNEVLIRVYAAEATKGDCELRSFNFPVKWFWLPLRLAWGISRPRKRILGGYFSGVVECVGEAVTRLKQGDEVFGVSKLLMGAYAEYICLPEKYPIVPKPDNMSFTEAAAVPLGGLNALHFLSKANIQAGEKVLVNGAGGSIGTFAVQIAKAMGAEVTVVDSGIKQAMLNNIGADHFIDYTKNNYVSSGQTWDVIFDMVAGSDLLKSIDALSSGGRYVTANPTFKKMISAGKIFKKTGKKVITAFAGELEEELLTLKSMIEKGEVRAAVDKVFPMEEAAEAHRRVETEQRIGIVVISMTGDKNE